MSFKLIKKSISASGGENVRIDKFLANQILNMTRTQIKKLFLNGLVQVNESFAKPGSILKGDEVITFSVPEIDQTLDQIEPENISLNILYESWYFFSRRAAFAFAKSSNWITASGNTSATVSINSSTKESYSLP